MVYLVLSIMFHVKHLFFKQYCYRRNIAIAFGKEKSKRFALSFLEQFFDRHAQTV